MLYINKIQENNYVPTITFSFIYLKIKFKVNKICHDRDNKPNEWI